jgi:hypothetical protein
MRITSSRKTSRIIGHTWKWRRLWGFNIILGCLFPIGRYKLQRHLAPWQTPYRFGRAPVPAELSFYQCAYAFTTLQYLCYNCESDPCSRSGLKNHLTMGTSYTVRRSKSNESRGTKWTADPQWLGSWSFDGITADDESPFHYLYE